MKTNSWRSAWIILKKMLGICSLTYSASQKHTSIGFLQMRTSVEKMKPSKVCLPFIKMCMHKEVKATRKSQHAPVLFQLSVSPRPRPSQIFFTCTLTRHATTYTLKLLNNKGRVKIIIINTCTNWRQKGLFTVQSENKNHKRFHYH